MEFPVGGEEAKFWVVVMRMGRRGLLRRPWVRGPKHFGTSETGACLWSSGGLKTLDTVDLGIWACRRRVGGGICESFALRRWLGLWEEKGQLEREAKKWG